MLNVANVSVLRSKRSSFTAKPNSLAGRRAHRYVYAYNNDIHNVATNHLLMQQLFKVLFFLVKFKTMGLMDEPNLATKLFAKALSSN